MTITQAEIQEIKNANGAINSKEAVAALIAKFERELVFKAESKKGAVKITITSPHTHESREIIGQSFGDGLAFHKDAFGGKTWRLTHIKSEIPLFSGKRDDVKKKALAFVKWDGSKIILAAMDEHGYEALKHVEQDIIDRYRAIYTMD